MIGWMLAWGGACTDSSAPTSLADPLLRGSQTSVFVTGGAVDLLGDVLVRAAPPDGVQVFQMPGRYDDWEPKLKLDLRLPVGVDPGQVRMLAGGRALVVLRGAGTVLSVDVEAARVEPSVPVCAEPRGLGVDPDRSGAWVACRTGELVHVDAEGQILASGWVDTDLRDVVVDGDVLWVSRFRSAEVLRVDPITFEVLDRFAPLRVEREKAGFPGQVFHYAPRVAWRMVADPNGGVAVVHQLHQEELVEQAPLGTPEYYGPPEPVFPCGGIVLGEITRFDEHGTVDPLPPMGVAVPFDLAIDPDGDYVVATMGAVGVDGPAVLQVGEEGDCASLTERSVVYPTGSYWFEVMGGTATGGAIVFDELFLPGQRYFVSGAVPSDAEPFQVAGDAGIACVSCHPDGQDDGHVWTLVEEGSVPRRTPALSGGLSETAPFHWRGDLGDMTALWSSVGVVRMGLDASTLAEVPEVTAWLDEVPSPAPSGRPDPSLVQAGAQLFADPVVGCFACHPSPTYTDDHTYDVGTGGRLQVPSLRGVSARLPIMHDGCAETLMDRFTDLACGGGDEHGVTSRLTSEELDALVAFLETL